jgi:ABC-type Mn2+/Zn2+ transport system ATPase subunit
MSGTFHMSWQRIVSGHSFERVNHDEFSGVLSGPGLRAVVGPNGCGKSTLLKTWLGILKPISGQIIVQTTQPLGYVPQQSSVNPLFHISIENFIRLGAERSKRNAFETNVLIKSLADVWELNLNTSFHSLSAGQKTRALVARALALEPDILFLDEPLANLDKHCQTFLMEELHKYSHQRNMSVVIVDHHLAGYERWFSETYEFKYKHNSSICEIESRKQVHKC